MDRDPVDGVAFALGKLTEALLEQVRLTKIAEAHGRTQEQLAEANTRAQKQLAQVMQKKLRARTKALREAIKHSDEYDAGGTVLDREVRDLLEKWKKEDEE